MAGLQFKNDISIFSGGYAGEETGTTGSVTDWRDAPTSGTSTASYYYRDSEIASNSRSSRVVVNITTTWHIDEISRDNFITITTNTTINSIVRDSIINYNPYPAMRHIWIRQNENSPVIFEAGADNPSIAHTISGPIDAGTKTFTIAPGGQDTRKNLYYRNTTVGFENLSVPNIYTDIMYMGVSFRNTLPADYVPGKILDADGVWQSHNRVNGTEKIRHSNGAWTEMRTLNGGQGTGNAPTMRYPDGTWKNQREIGENQQ